MKKSKLIFDYLLMVAVAVMIVVFAILREQSFIKTLPTLITLVVQMLTVKASRYAFLLGGANAVLYGISYYTEGVYFSMISALAISVPIQFYSFAVWSKKRSNTGTKLKALGVKRLLVTIVATLLGWLLCYFCLSGFFNNASYPLIDCYLFAASITVSLLAAWRYIESQYLNVISSCLSLILWILLTVRDPANFNYVIISAYNLFRITQAVFSWTKKYRETKENALKENEI